MIKKILIAVGLGVLAPSVVLATPYFRLLDLNSPQTSVGAAVDVVHPTNTAFTTSLAVITHAPADGCLLPAVACEDWTPLAMSYSAGAGTGLFGLGPSANLSNAVRAGLAKGITALNDMRAAPYQTAANLAAALQPGTSDLNIAFGPSWFVSPTENWKGYFRFVAGVAWKW